MQLEEMTMTGPVYPRKAVELLTDAMVMLEQIERNRNMPATTQTQQQYVALGKSIRDYLSLIGELR